MGYPPMPPSRHMLLLLLLLSTTLHLLQGDYVRGGNAAGLTSTALSRATRIGENLLRLRGDTVLIIDGDNVRGKTGFSVSKEQLVTDVQLFQRRFRFSERVVLLFDHGAEQEGYALTSSAPASDGPAQTLALVFSGTKTADDVIARDVSYFLRACKVPVCVVTSDSGLKGRCQRAARAVEMMSRGAGSDLSSVGATSGGSLVSDGWAPKGGTLNVRPVSFLDSNTFVELLGAVVGGELGLQHGSLTDAGETVEEAQADEQTRQDPQPPPAPAPATPLLQAQDQAELQTQGFHPLGTPLDPQGHEATRLLEHHRKAIRLSQQLTSLDALIGQKSQGRKRLAKLRERREEIARALDKIGGQELVYGVSAGVSVGVGGSTGDDGEVSEDGDDGDDGDDDGESEQTGEFDAAGSVDDASSSGSLTKHEADAALLDSLLRLGSGKGKGDAAGPTGAHREETWQRCILAERLRAAVLLNSVATAATASSVATVATTSAADTGRGEGFGSLPFEHTTAAFPSRADKDTSPSTSSVTRSNTLSYLRELNRSSRTNFTSLVSLFADCRLSKEAEDQSASGGDPFAPLKLKLGPATLALPKEARSALSKARERVRAGSGKKAKTKAKAKAG